MPINHHGSRGILPLFLLLCVSCLVASGCGRSYMYYGDDDDLKEICGNSIDDDFDGLTDCADPDCKNDPGCKGTPEDCENGQDDDGDGVVDCQDPDC